MAESTGEPRATKVEAVEEDTINQPEAQEAESKASFEEFVEHGPYSSLFPDGIQNSSDLATAIPLYAKDHPDLAGPLDTCFSNVLTPESKNITPQAAAEQIQSGGIEDMLGTRYFEMLKQEFEKTFDTTYDEALQATPENDAQENSTDGDQQAEAEASDPDNRQQVIETLVNHENESLRNLGVLLQQNAAASEIEVVFLSDEVHQALADKDHVRQIVSDLIAQLRQSSASQPESQPADQPAASQETESTYDLYSLSEDELRDALKEVTGIGENTSARFVDSHFGIMSLLDIQELTKQDKNATAADLLQISGVGLKLANRIAAKFRLPQIDLENTVESDQDSDQNQKALELEIDRFKRADRALSQESDQEKNKQLELKRDTILQRIREIVAHSGQVDFALARSVNSKAVKSESLLQLDESDDEATENQPSETESEHKATAETDQTVNLQPTDKEGEGTQATPPPEVSATAEASADENQENTEVAPPTREAVAHAIETSQLPPEKKNFLKQLLSKKTLGVIGSFGGGYAAGEALKNLRPDIYYQFIVFIPVLLHTSQDTLNLLKTEALDKKSRREGWSSKFADAMAKVYGAAHAVASNAYAQSWAWGMVAGIYSSRAIDAATAVMGTAPAEPVDVAEVTQIAHDADSTATDLSQLSNVQGRSDTEPGAVAAPVPPESLSVLDQQSSVELSSEPAAVVHEPLTQEEVESKSPWKRFWEGLGFGGEGSTPEKSTAIEIPTPESETADPSPIEPKESQPVPVEEDPDVTITPHGREIKHGELDLLGPKTQEGSEAIEPDSILTPDTPESETEGPEARVVPAPVEDTPSEATETERAVLAPRELTSDIPEGVTQQDRVLDAARTEAAQLSPQQITELEGVAERPQEGTERVSQALQGLAPQAEEAASTAPTTRAPGLSRIEPNLNPNGTGAEAAVAPEAATGNYVFTVDTDRGPWGEIESIAREKELFSNAAVNAVKNVDLLLNRAFDIDYTRLAPGTGFAEYAPGVDMTQPPDSGIGWALNEEAMERIFRAVQYPETVDDEAVRSLIEKLANPPDNNLPELSAEELQSVLEYAYAKE